MEKREFCWEQMPVLYVNYFFFLSFSCHQLQLLCINMIMYNNNSSMYVCVSTVCFDKKNLELKQFVCKLIQHLNNFESEWSVSFVYFWAGWKVFTRHGFFECRKSVLMAFLKLGCLIYGPPVLKKISIWTNSWILGRIKLDQLL